MLTLDEVIQILEDLHMVYDAALHILGQKNFNPGSVEAIHASKLRDVLWHTLSAAADMNDCAVVEIRETRKVLM